MIAAKSEIRGSIGTENWRSYGKTIVDCVRLIFLVRGSHFRARRENWFASRPESDGRRDVDSIFRDRPHLCVRAGMDSQCRVAIHQSNELYEDYRLQFQIGEGRLHSL